MEADTCPGCGQPRSESTLPENEFGFTALPIRCHGCATLRRAQRKWVGDGTDKTAVDGLTFSVRKDE